MWHRPLIIYITFYNKDKLYLKPWQLFSDHNVFARVKAFIRSKNLRGSIFLKSEENQHIMQ